MSTFKEAYKALCDGKAIKRATWLGYWVADGQNVLMHCKDGTVVSMKDGCIPMFTLGGCTEDDWMILDDAHRAEFDKIHAAKILTPAADQKKAEEILKEREFHIGVPRCFGGRLSNVNCPYLAKGYCTMTVLCSNPPQYQACSFCHDVPQYALCKDVQ